ncbi:MAG TPA: cyclomaltodextrinase C-terminal domain-containing protein, partial [Puia sp.]|nr:cyclomaltodextrinase C-terminal domain-containing protein [Puia sp.]
GKMMQYLPSHGLYVYFRWDAKQTVLCAMNTDSLPARLDIERYNERTAGFSEAADVLTGRRYPLQDIPAIPAGEMRIFELKKAAN